MTTRSQAPIVRMIIALIRNQPVRYTISCLLYTSDAADDDYTV